MKAISGVLLGGKVAKALEIYMTFLTCLSCYCGNVCFMVYVKFKHFQGYFISAFPLVDDWLPDDLPYAKSSASASFAAGNFTPPLN